MAAIELNGYELSRSWFNFCFEHPEKISPNHTALFFFCIEHCNRLGWKKKFGLPTTMAKEAIGIKSYNTYIKSLNDLVDWGFIIMVEKSKNQYSSNIIALSKNDKAHNKALDKAMLKHVTKQSESTQQSISSIDKPLTINNKPLTEEPIYYMKDCKNPSNEKVITLSIKLFNAFLKAYPDNKDIPLLTVSEFVKPIRELMVKREYSEDQIIAIVDFSYEDTFWNGKVTDTASLLKHFEKLKDKYKKEIQKV